MNKSFADILNKEGYLIYPISGNSMYPLLNDSEVVRIEKSDTYQKYDVVLYKKKDKYVLHRIIDIDNVVYKIKGDNALQIDLIYKEDILGIMKGYYKKEEYISTSDDRYKEYLSKYVLSPKARRRKAIVRDEISKTYTLNDSIKEAYRELFRYSVSLDIDIEKIKKLDDEEFINLIYLCAYKKSEHILSEVVDKYHLEINEKYKWYIEKAKELNKSKYLFLDYYKNEISKLLTTNKINHLFIKGSKLRDRYISPILRSSNDIDIYVDKKDIEKVKELIIDKYHPTSIKDESVHYVFSIHNGKGYVEVHYALLEDDMNNISSIIGDPISHSEQDKDNPYLYHMNKDYYYLYHLAHYAKHMLGGEYWIGMMQDTYLLKDDGNDNKLLEAAGLNDFHKALIDTLDVWVKHKEETSASKAIETLIFKDAFTNYVLGEQKKYKNKFAYILRRVFLTKKEMTDAFPSMNNHSYLYPIYFFIRLFKVIFSKKIKKPLKELHTYSSLKKEDLNNIYKAAGLLSINKYFIYKSFQLM